MYSLDTTASFASQFGAAQGCETPVVAVYNLPLDVLIAKLAVVPNVWVRLGAAQSDGEWSLRMLELTTGDPPPNWETLRWEYPQAVFAALPRKGAAVAQWLRSRKARIGSRSLSLTEIAETVSHERRESGWRGGVAYAPLSWPSEEWRLGRGSTLQYPHEPLVADASPSFVSFDAAAASVLGVVLTGWNMSGRECVARLQDQRGRLRSVHIRPTEVRIQVEGESLRGSVVELAGHEVGPTQRLTTNRSRSVRFPLPNGLPEGAWVVLRQGSEWLDRRFLRWPYAQAEQAGVEFEIAATTRLEALVGGGEGPATEFKAEMPGEDEESKRKVMKTVAAFANGEGGSVLFGVSDSGEIAGFTRDEIGPRARDRLSNLVRSWVWPAASFRVEVLQAEESSDRHVLVLTVDSGERPPYAAGTQPTNLMYYVRRGANSFPASADEVRDLARARPQAEAAGRFRRVDRPF